MLPSIRAILGAIVAAIVLLMISSGLVATFRIAQDTRARTVQVDFAQRGRYAPLADELPAALPVEKPAPLEANPVAEVEVGQTPDIIAEAPQTFLQDPENFTTLASTPADVEQQAPGQPFAESATAEPPAMQPPARETIWAEQPAEISTIEQLIAALAPSEAPMGGPLAEQTLTHTQPPGRKAAQDAAARIAKKKAAQAAVRKARAQRIARERKTAARRAPQARAKEQPVGAFNTAPFSNSFGNFGNGTFGTGASGR
jgi:hypothetical protein